MATTLYFAYMSNMSPKRMHQSCPNAEVKSIGKLQDYKLVFIGYKEEWKGAYGNAVFQKGHEVWGVVWELAGSDMPGLQGTETGGDIEFTVPTFEIVSPEGQAFNCLLFKRESEESDINLPSPQYVQVGIEGAICNNLPKTYVDFMKKITTNQNSVITEAMQKALQ